jgi:hypothetical protein
MRAIAVEAASAAEAQYREHLRRLEEERRHRT